MRDLDNELIKDRRRTVSNVYIPAVLSTIATAPGKHNNTNLKKYHITIEESQSFLPSENHMAHI
jgi:hypothetical protein